LRRSSKRIEDLIEDEARRKSIVGFMEEWNKWRDFYFDLPPMEPKTKGQLTAIENAIQFADQHQFRISLLIACVMRAYKGSSFRPNFHAIVRRGEELYEMNYDLVLADVDRDDYEQTSDMRDK
jgi:hypothetical protein